MPFPRFSSDDSPYAETVAAEQRISADSHMAEPPDLWEKRLPKEFSDRALKFPNVKLFETGIHLRAGGWDPKERIRDQAYDSISAEVLYPTLGYQAYQVDDHALEEACCRVYNDWLFEFCSTAPERLWGLGMISLWDIDQAVKELERCKQGGMRGATIGLVPADGLPYSSPHYERFWAACREMEMSVNFHINSGPGRPRSFNGGLQPRAGLLPDGVHKFDCMRAVGDMIASGVLERYPELKVVVAEAGVGWIPFFAQEFDYYKNVFSGRGDALPRPPSEYIDRQVFGAFISDNVGGKLLQNYGQDNFMWSNDYPHPACIWPISTAAIATDLGHLTPEVRGKVTSGTAAKLYNNGQLPPPAAPKGDVQDMNSWEKAHWSE